VPIGGVGDLPQQSQRNIRATVQAQGFVECAGAYDAGGNLRQASVTVGRFRQAQQAEAGVLLFVGSLVVLVGRHARRG